ncbi:DeoR/GlpR family DNA-binding transcription regulator [Wenjunlia tyrosinilytica]|uniref:DeoR family transcriptional regulator n=1 Tax=Wenjunlia tyrosinilytica TaxID=1544741 RepID=A0A917ZV74_9ACTN|nr:DeoR/GlpR family DNA-binding transcription regulator [Wenjunlia tyrosinilytica]GGO95703.1 DeoR family transcriptional regulator [Wenjunlia tyrosinilytica]
MGELGAPAAGDVELSGEAAAGVSREPSGELVGLGLGERREFIRREVVKRGFARIDDLARALGVSAMTVHRDLDALAEEGWLTKIRGGATANPSALLEAGVRERSAALSAEKEAIAARAARSLSRGQTVFVDDSTTALALHPHLTAAAPLTVVTNFFPLVRALGATKGIETLVLGGRYHPLQEACSGLQTTDAIRRLHADVLFMSTTAVSGGACYHRSEETVAVKRAFMECASRSVLLVDHAKFGRRAPHLLASVEAFDQVITDEGVDEEELATLRERGAGVEIAPMSR